PTPAPSHCPIDPAKPQDERSVSWGSATKAIPMTETTRLLADLVAIPSVNPMRADIPADIILEHRVTAYLEQFFRSLGVPYERQPVAPQRDNIVARLTIPGARRTLMLEAHQDTVPVDGMIVEPFGPK